MPDDMMEKEGMPLTRPAAAGVLPAEELRDLESDFESLAKRTDEAEVVLFSESGWTPDILPVGS